MGNMQQKKPLAVARGLGCARDRSRTDTDVTPLVPETSASAISPPGLSEIVAQR